RMFAAAIAFALVGLVVLAGLRPDGAGAYWRSVTAGGPERTAVIVGHQALVLPNQSILILAPAMGSCDVATLAAGTLELLCFGREPVARTIASMGLLGGVPPHNDRMPAAFFVMVFVPLGAVLWGGFRAGRDAP